MSVTYRITLVHLTADAMALAPESERLELGSFPFEEVVRYAERLVRIAPQAAGTKLEPGIVVHRGDRSYRIAVHLGRLRVHKSVSLFDDYWSVDTPAELAELPPFATGPGAAPVKSTPRGRGPRQVGTVRSVLEVAGLFAVAVILVAVGLRFGLPQKRLSDLPPDVTLVHSASDREAVFNVIAGSYATGKTPGNSLVIIQPDGRVQLSTIGKDGRPTPPRIQEQARAGRRGNVACVITSFGIIAGIEPPDLVNVGRFQYRRTPVDGSAVTPPASS